MTFVDFLELKILTIDVFTKVNLITSTFVISKLFHRSRFALEPLFVLPKGELDLKEKIRRKFDSVTVLNKLSCFSTPRSISAGFFVSCSPLQPLVTLQTRVKLVVCFAAGKQEQRVSRTLGKIIGRVRKFFADFGTHCRKLNHSSRGLTNCKLKLSPLPAGELNWLDSPSTEEISNRWNTWETHLYCYTTSE